jgi:hypothetical protein
MPDPTATQKLLANVRALRQQNAPEEVIAAEMEKWKPRIAAENTRDMADAGSAGNLFARGLTSGFSDEIAGAADAVGAMLPGGQSPMEAYRGTRDVLRETNDAYAQVNPGKALGAELAGGLVQGVGTGIGAARAVPGALAGAARMVPAALTTGRTGARIAQAGLAGAAAGGLAGVGGADSMEDIPRSAGIGAMSGGIAGAGLGAAGAGVGGVLRRTGITAPRDPNTGNAVQRGAKAVGRALGASTADDAAALRVVDAIEVGGPGGMRRTVEEAIDAANLDRTSTLADVNVGGNKAARLAGTARRLGNTAAEQADEVFGNRTAQRGVKMQGDLAEISGVGRFSPDDEAETLIQQARQAARPFYDELRALGPIADNAKPAVMEMVPPPTVAQSPAPSVREAIEAHRTRLGLSVTRNEGTVMQQSAREALERRAAEASVPAPRPFSGGPSPRSVEVSPEVPAPPATDVILDAVNRIPRGRMDSFWKNVRDIAQLDGDEILPADLIDESGRLTVPITPRLGDYFKKAMDEVIYSGSRQTKMGQPGGLTNTETALLNNARNQIVKALDDATGGPDGVYARARAAYAGPVSIREALESGRDLRNLDEGQLARATRGLSAEQREAFNRGGVEATQRTLSTMPEGRLGIPRNFTSPVRRAQMDAVLGPKSGQWRDLVEGEVAREQTEGIILRGSPTAERLADDEMGTLLTNMPSSPGGLLGRIAGSALQRGERALVRGSTADEMDATMRILSTNIGDVTTRLEVMALLNAGKTARAEQVARAALQKAGVAGVVGGRNSAPPQ